MHEEKGHQPEAPAPAPDLLEAIMATGELPAGKQQPPEQSAPELKAPEPKAPELKAPEPKARARNLGAEALAAAHAAQPRAANSGHDHDVPGAPMPPLSLPRREWVWRTLLVVNLAVLAAVVAVPSQPTAPANASPTEHGDKPVRPMGFKLTEQTFYLRALELAGAGKFDDAITVLDGYLKANPDLVEVEQRLIYHAMAMFAVRAGRNDDATRFEAAMDRLRVGAQLPQDLLDLAKQAEAEGRGADMRRYYARFLLQQKQVSPSLKARIAEAYLKLGDGYRVEAEQGVEREAASKREAELTPPSSGAERKGGHE